MMKRTLEKYSLLLLFLLIFSAEKKMSAQQFSDQELLEFSNFNIEVSKVNLENIKIQNDLHSILKFDNKKSRHEDVGTVIASISVLIVLSGIAIKNSSNSYITDTGLGVAYIGTLIGAVSIPFFIAASSKKKKRDALI